MCSGARNPSQQDGDTLMSWTCVSSFPEVRDTGAGIGAAEGEISGSEGPRHFGEGRKAPRTKSIACLLGEGPAGEEVSSPQTRVTGEPPVVELPARCLLHSTTVAATTNTQVTGWCKTTKVSWALPCPEQCNTHEDTLYILAPASLHTSPTHTHKHTAPCVYSEARDPRGRQEGGQRPAFGGCPLQRQSGRGDMEDTVTLQGKRLEVPCSSCGQHPARELGGSSHCKNKPCLGMSPQGHGSAGHRDRQLPGCCFRLGRSPEFLFPQRILPLLTAHQECQERELLGL